MSRQNVVFPPIIVFIVISFVVEIVVRFGWVPSFLVPMPSQVLSVFWKDGQELFRAISATAIAAICGFLISLVVGVSAALTIQRFPFFDRAFYPYAVFFQTVPIIAIAPLLVIWIGFGINTVIASSSIVCVFPIISSSLDGMRNINLSFLELFQLYGASQRDTLFKLRVPSAIFSILSGLKIASGLAVIGAIVGEFVTGGGIGGLVDIARTQQRVDKVFAAIILGSLLGLVMVKSVDGIAGWFSNRGFGERDIRGQL